MRDRASISQVAQEKPSAAITSLKRPKISLEIKEFSQVKTVNIAKDDDGTD